MYRRWIFLLLPALLVHTFLLAQDQAIESIVDNDHEQTLSPDMLEDLLQLQESPLNINRASAVELIRLPWIDAALAKQLIDYRRSHAPFTTPSQLLMVPGITNELLEKILPYITFDEVPSGNWPSVRYRTRFHRKYDANSSGSDLRSPYSLYQRLQTSYRKQWDFGLITEKDAGENELSDFWAGYIQYQGNNSEDRIIAGDYRIEAGQGLALWGPYGYGKGSEAIAFVNKQEHGLLPYTLVDENASLFGLAVQKCVKIYQLLVFISHKGLDANPDSATVTKNLYESGYHRTDYEIASRDLVQEKLAGGRLIFRPGSYWHIGFTAYRASYNHPVGSSDTRRQYFHFRGKQNSVQSFDFSYANPSLKLFGEIARSTSGGTGSLGGFVLKLRPVQLSIVHRRYDRHFHSLHGISFGSFTGHPQNEIGTYFGLRIAVTKGIQLNAYFDSYYHPWRTYLVPAPNGGIDMFLQLRWKLPFRTTLWMQGKQKRRWTNVTISDIYGRQIHYLMPEQRQNWRFQMEYKPQPSFRLRGRIEIVRYDNITRRNGMLLYQDVRYQPFHRLVVYGRLTFFDTDDYASRVYQFENDVPFVLTNRSLNGQGSCWYLSAQYRPFSNIRISAKFISIHYEPDRAGDLYHPRRKGHTDRQFRVQLETRM